ncbi:MAG: hypothetical protein K0B05_00110 [Bacteroidales bacterium]|nr:hypothetical protein [Bacteroidales bacterium]
MDFNATIDLIIKDLREAQEIIDDLKKYPGVPVLQVELAKSRCKSAGEVIACLKDIQSRVTAETVSVSTAREQTEEPSIVSDNTAGQIPDKPEIVPEVQNELIEMVTETREAVQQPARKPVESTIIADKFSHLSSRFNEQLGSSRGPDEVTEMLKSKPLKNLSDAIGFNDKFLFIREIFNGNKDVYTQAITRLESAGSLSEARGLIMNYKGDDEENEAVIQLLDILKRKFPAHG